MAEQDVAKPAPVYTPPPPHVPAIANPVPLGLFAFGTTTFVLSCYNAGIFGMHLSTPPNFVVGLAVFYGGISQFLAGMWEFKTGNTFGATAFSSYGAFWLSYAAILIPWFGVADSFTLNGKEEGSALGIFLLGWALFTLMMWFGTLRTNIALSTLFVFLTLTFLLLSISEFKRGDGLRIKRVTDAYPKKFLTEKDYLLSKGWFNFFIFYFLFFW
jgi:succinate-acetate transporter protein